MAEKCVVTLRVIVYYINLFKPNAQDEIYGDASYNNEMTYIRDAHYCVAFIHTVILYACGISFQVLCVAFCIALNWCLRRC